MLNDIAKKILEFFYKVDLRSTYSCHLRLVMTLPFFLLESVTRFQVQVSACFPVFIFFPSWRAHIHRNNKILKFWALSKHICLAFLPCIRSKIMLMHPGALCRGR